MCVDLNEKDFSDVPVGDRFYFRHRKITTQEPYLKVEEIRRAYTPEAYSNASFDWKTVDPRTDTLISEGTTFFYVTPTSRVWHITPHKGATMGDQTLNQTG